MDWHVCQKQSPPWFIAVWCALDPSRFLLLMGQGYDLFCNPKHAGILSYMVLCHKGCKTIKKEHTPRFFWGFFTSLSEWVKCRGKASSPWGSIKCLLLLLPSVGFENPNKVLLKTGNQHWSLNPQWGSIAGHQVALVSLR